MYISEILRPEILEYSKGLGVEPSLLQAIIQTECKYESGFVEGTKEPIILYECHVAYRLTVKALGKEKADSLARLQPDIINPYPYNTKYNKYKYGLISEQHKKFQKAIDLVGKPIAVQSCSWGIGQIMGENWWNLGYKSIQEFINCMYASEVKQLDAMIRFIKTKKGLLQAIKAKDIKKIALLYNGTQYAKNQYDVKISQYYKQFRGKYGT